LESNVVTFAQLADYCEKEIYVEAEYNDAGEKLSGVRDVSTCKAHLKHTREFFKTKKLKDISIADLKRYCSHRLRCTRRGRKIPCSLEKSKIESFSFMDF